MAHPFCAAALSPHLFPREDSNLHTRLRRPESCPLNERGMFRWTLQGLNLRPTAYQTVALPAELSVRFNSDAKVMVRRNEAKSLQVLQS